jgi:hypothetical protein
MYSNSIPYLNTNVIESDVVLVDNLGNGDLDLGADLKVGHSTAFSASPKKNTHRYIFQ